MTFAIIMGIIGGFFCTLFFNPFMIKQFFRGLRLTFVKTPPDDKDKENSSKKEKRFDFNFYGPSEARTFVIVQIIFFLIGTGILTSWYYFGTVDRTFSQFLATGWLIGIIHIVNWCVLELINDSDSIFEGGYYAKPPKGFRSGAAIFSIGIFVVSIAFLVAGSFYNFSHQQETTTFIQEETVPVVSVDTLKTLENQVLIDGYELGNAINRNGKVVIPMKRDGNVSFAGYVVIENDQPIIVPKDLRYTPDHGSTNNPDFIARNNMPTKIFFGDWSFQLKPVEGKEDEVYYIRMYGEFKFLRAGRNIEGMVFVNAETGEFSYCSLDDVPDWINGVSQ